MATTNITTAHLNDLLKRLVVDLTTAIGEELESTARQDNHMDSATKSALYNVAHVIQHGIDPEWIVQNAVAKFVEEDL